MVGDWKDAGGDVVERGQFGGLGGSSCEGKGESGAEKVHLCDNAVGMQFLNWLFK